MKDSPKYILTKRQGLAVLFILLLIDTLFDVIRGTQGNPIFKPIENSFGIWVFPFLVPFVVVFFYAVVKFFGRVVYKIDKTPHADEILLTALAVIFAVHDIWVFSLDFLGFSLIKDFRHMIPVYIVAGLAYALWIEHRMRKK